jgi:hypothetical protein
MFFAGLMATYLILTAENLIVYNTFYHNKVLKFYINQFSIEEHNPCQSNLA